MILYLDTSALVKLFIDEIGSRQIRDAVAASDGLASSLISYTEARSAFARKHRLGEISQADYQQYKQEFERYWPAINQLIIAVATVRRAADLCELYALRAYDGVQLASAESLQSSVATRVTFASFDEALNKGASALGMSTL